LHIMSWYMQLHPGHGVFEGRKPALLDGLVQVQHCVRWSGPT
jgi:2-hydroxy fatty acid dioxygenase